MLSILGAGQRGAVLSWICGSEIILTGSPGAAPVNFSGYYTYAAWFLTGELRSSSYLTSASYIAPGTFGQIKILNPFRAGGWDAFELAARVERNQSEQRRLPRRPSLPVSVPTSRVEGRRTSPLTSTGIPTVECASWPALVSTDSFVCGTRPGQLVVLFWREAEYMWRARQ